jgi:hypothetical protein
MIELLERGAEESGRGVGLAAANGQRAEELMRTEEEK